MCQVLLYQGDVPHAQIYIYCFHIFHIVLLMAHHMHHISISAPENTRKRRASVSSSYMSRKHMIWYSVRDVSNESDKFKNVRYTINFQRFGQGLFARNLPTMTVTPPYSLSKPRW